MGRKKLERLQCVVDGCNKVSTFAAESLCQMHYFRRMRNGGFELKKQKKERRENPAGYQWVLCHDHPLAVSTGYVYEHRKVLYEKLDGIASPCELCGKPLTWGILHVDHIDNNVRNNHPCNLRATCTRCNTGRGAKQPRWMNKGNTAITYFGETKTVSEWGRDTRTPVHGYVIRQRICKGWDIEDAMFTPNHCQRRCDPSRLNTHESAERS